MDLVDLDARVDENAKVHDAYADDLDGILAPQRVVHQHNLVKESKDEQRQVGRNGLCILGFARSGRIPRHRQQLRLELGKDVSTSRQQGVQDSITTD
jgi:hypothetical protein